MTGIVSPFSGHIPTSKVSLSKQSKGESSASGSMSNASNSLLTLFEKVSKQKHVISIYILMNKFVFNQVICY